jgi:hypothetical protein
MATTRAPAPDIPTPQSTAPWTWPGNNDPTRAAREVLAHPRFAEAARALARDTIRWSDEDRALCALFRDAGHYVAAMSVLLLDASGGLTLAQLKEICAATDFASPGRARLLLQFLQHIGFVEAATTPGRSLRYHPTPAFVTAWRGHLRGALAAAALIDGRVASLSEKLDDRGTFATFLQVEAARLQQLAATTRDVPPFERLFMQRFAGLQIVAEMVVSSGESGFLADAAVRISARQSAARFGVSHMHVRRLLADAVAEGLLRPLGTARYALDGGLRETIAFFYAIQLAELVASALLTLEALPAADVRIVELR